MGHRARGQAIQGGRRGGGRSGGGLSRSCASVHVGAIRVLLSLLRCDSDFRGAARWAGVCQSRGGEVGGAQRGQGRLPYCVTVLWGEVGCAKSPPPSSARVFVRGVRGMRGHRGGVCKVSGGHAGRRHSPATAHAPSSLPRTSSPRGTRTAADRVRDGRRAVESSQRLSTSRASCHLELKLSKVVRNQFDLAFASAVARSGSLGGLHLLSLALGFGSAALLPQTSPLQALAGKRRRMEKRACSLSVSPTLALFASFATCCFGAYPATCPSTCHCTRRSSIHKPAVRRGSAL